MTSATAQQTTNAQTTARRRAATPDGLGLIHPIACERAEGHLLWDVEGNRYYDFCGGIGVLNVGHNHPKVVQAVKDQADKFLHTCFHVAMYDGYISLAEKLNNLVPIDGPCKTALFNSGAEAGENAVKICRMATKRTGVVGFERAFHGRTLLGMTLTGKTKPYSAGMGPFAPEVYRLPVKPFFASHRRHTDAEVERMAKDALDNLFAYHIEPENVACVMIEPVLGEGGFYPAHCVAMKILRETCAQHGILFIADEVQSGFGRCGANFAIERYEIEPDMVAMAKSMGDGLPISAVTARSEIMDSLHVGAIGGTYGGNPLACAAALAVLDVMKDERLPERALKIGEKVMALFFELEKTYDFIGDVRGLGAMCAFEVVLPGTMTPDPDRCGKILAAARDKGLLIMRASGNVVRTLMPLTIPDEDLDDALRILKESVAAVA
ncbi:MAG: aminotransferase class III-fold pyridoxal phosphate-dependent enzyme [Sumerlaeia bacterium]